MEEYEPKFVAYSNPSGTPEVLVASALTFIANALGEINQTLADMHKNNQHTPVAVRKISPAIDSLARVIQNKR